jgi:hypothetical protein
VDIFAAGHSRRGRVRWARRFGGAGTDHAFDDDADSRGAGLLTGTFNGTVAFGRIRLVSRGATLPAYGDAFLLKLDDRGRVRWVRQIGGPTSDGGDEVAVGPRNDAFVIGDTEGDVRLGPRTVLRATGGRDSWAARYRPSGRLVWATSLGGSGDQQSHGITADRAANAVATGEFRGAAQFGSHTLRAFGSGSDVFLAKLDRRGRVRWAQRFGGPGDQLGRGVGTDPKGHVYFTREYRGTIQIGSRTLTSIGDHDMFVAKATSGGRELWAISLGGPGDEVGPEVEVDRSGSAYLTGTFSGAARLGGHVLTAAGARAAFVAKVSPKGHVRWAAQSGPSPFATLGELALGPDTVNVLGRFGGTVQLGRFPLTSAGGLDFFLAQLPQRP